MNKQELAQRNLHIQSWVNFLSGATFLVPIITLFYTHTGLSLWEIVIISNVATFAIWLLEIPTSVLADTIGRKYSLQRSVVCNLLGAVTILLFPNFWGFIVASLFSALYWSFWSGTGQAFLAENLAILKRSDEFGKVIGSFMFYEQLALLCTPLVTSAILFQFGDIGFRLLAVIDVIFAASLVVLVYKLRDVQSLKSRKQSAAALFKENINTAKEAFNNVLHNSRLRLILVYRSLANHVAFFPLIVLPVMSDGGMPDWFSGVIIALAAIGTMLSAKYAYVLGERIGYRASWLIGTIIQGILLIAAGIFLAWWVSLLLLYFLFNIGEGLWQPAWNHVLVEETSGHAIATTRSVVFSVFALYTTVGKQILAIFSVSHALIGMGVFILLVNLLLGKKLLSSQKSN